MNCVLKFSIRLDSFIIHHPYWTCKYISFDEEINYIIKAACWIFFAEFFAHGDIRTYRHISHLGGGKLDDKEVGNFKEQWHSSSYTQSQVSELFPFQFCVFFLYIFVLPHMA